MDAFAVRWKQRLANYRKALSQLREVDQLAASRPLSSIETQGLVKAFEFTYELSWNVIKDYLDFQGTGIVGSRDAFREAHRRGLVSDGEGWMDMVRNRNLTSHTHDEKTAHEVVHLVRSRYLDLFVALEGWFAAREVDNP